MTPIKIEVLSPWVHIASYEGFPSKEESLAALKVGAWGTKCCQEDLHELTQAEVDEVPEDIAEAEKWEPWLRVWPTRREALLAIKRMWELPYIIEQNRPGVAAAAAAACQKLLEEEESE